MSESAPQETSQRALDLLQANYTAYDHPYSVRGVLSVVIEACDSSEALGSFLAPLRTANTLACWLHLPKELQEVAASSLPDKPENSYCQNLFDHVTQGEALDTSNQWLTNAFAIPSWENYYASHRELVRKAELEPIETHLVAGPHGNHRQYESDMVVAGIWMVCHQKSSKNWPIATHPERTADALHFSSYVQSDRTYSRITLSIASALARLEDEEHWRQVYDTGLEFLANSSEQDSFRKLMQPDQLAFAMQRGDYTQAVTTEAETFGLRHDMLSTSSLAALCTIIRENHENSE
jgi:hypothetical protein